MQKAVILIPGIKGTKIYDSNTIDNEVLWQDIRFNFEDFARTELSFEYNHQFYEEDFATIVKPLRLEPLAYKEFWNRLNPDYHYKFVFPYDWRLPNKENARRLKDFLHYLIEKSKASSRVKTITHFDFVTHSMGNMPLRYYIKENGMKLVNKIIFVTPPFRGAPDAISALTLGQGLFFNKDEIRKLARTLPALFELLPTYDYCSLDSENGQGIDLWNKENWQKNLVKEGVNPKKDNTIKKFITNLENAKNNLAELETWMDDLSDKEKERILVLVKSDVETLTNIVIEKRPQDGNPDNYFDFKESFKSNEGDGVVPHASSCCYHDDLVTYYLENRILQSDFEHAFILKDNRVQRIINSFLNSSESTREFNHNILGRTVHKVGNLELKEVEKNGLIHKVWKIN
jgi:hypothetical protein